MFYIFAIFLYIYLIIYVCYKSYICVCVYIYTNTYTYNLNLNLHLMNEAELFSYFKCYLYFLFCNLTAETLWFFIRCGLLLLYF